MRDLAACFSEYAVQVSDTSCSSYSPNSCISPTLIPSIQNSVTCLHRITPSSDNHILISLTWSTLSHGGAALTIVFGDDPSTAIKLTTTSRIFRKLKGTKAIDFNSAAIEVFWDLSAARYDSGPEPVDGYYVLITVDSELGLVAGDMGLEASQRKLKCGVKTAKSALISRQEHFSGNALYSTRARFSESGISHDILIQCSGDSDGFKYPALSVSIDKKPVIRVKRLQWNFRGNQTIFLDGLLIDLMWDVHGWFYNSGLQGPGYAVFMFRTRSGMDSRLWLEEKVVSKDEDKHEFSFMIYACKNNTS